MLGVAVLAVDRVRPGPETIGARPTNPIDDHLATAQVVDATVEAIRVADLADPAGATALLSCRNADEPPYQAAVDMTFQLPRGNSVGYLRGVAEAMARSGWSESAVSGEHFGHVLTKAGVTASMHRNVERTDLATMRLHGQCRVTGDHRAAASVWTEITGRLREPR